MDIVFVKELKVQAVIGVFPWERAMEQTLVLDLEMAHDNRPAAASDELADALDYLAVSLRIKALLKEQQFKLVEALAETVAACIREEFQVPWLRLKLSKPGAVRDAAAVGVIIERGQLP